MTLIFDWDGTLHDTLRLYGRAVRAACRQLVQDGYAPPREYSDRELSVYLGIRAADMWDEFMPALPQAVKSAAIERVGREMERAIRRGEARLYDGVPAVLDRLSRAGHTMVILSNCRHAYLWAHRDFWELDRWFSGYYCCEDYDGKPKEQIVPRIMARFPGPYLVIGDRASDFRAAHCSGLPCIGCAYGFGSPEELAQADRTADVCGDIPRLVALETARH